MAQGLTGEQYLTMIRELIRLDIPICLVGSSSIGKSYSTRQFAMECGIETNFLFVGTEKAEYLEGIPMIKSAEEIAENRKKAEKSGSAVEGMDKFNYLQPYWFPDNAIILKRAEKGLAALRKERPDFFKGDVSYADFDGYRNELARLPIQNKDTLMVMSMVLGYGNFWLVLDEIDKVQENDIDKYAPLLHIVRERELKGWQLSGVRQSEYKGAYDVKETPLISDRIAKVSKAIEDKVNVTDTRIIAIGNETKNLRQYSEALYRRFIHIPIRTSLYIETKENLEQLNEKDGNWAQIQWKQRKKDLHKCIVNKKIDTNTSVLDKMAEIDEDIIADPLDEMNLQWTLGFLPEMLFPLIYIDSSKTENKDYVPNKFVNQFVSVVKREKKYEPQIALDSTYIGQMVRDNFEPRWYSFIIDCVKESLIQENTKSSVNLGEQLATDILKAGGLVSVAEFKSPSVSGVKTVINEYIKLQKSNESEFKAKISGGTKGTTAATENLIGKLIRFVETGNYLVIKTMNGNEMTPLSKILFEVIPAIQLNLMVKSPYISYVNMADAEEERNRGLKDMVKKVTAATYASLDKPENFRDNLSLFNAITNAIELNKEYKDLIEEYFYGVMAEDIKEFEEKVVNVSPLKIDKALKTKFLNKIIEYNPVSMPTIKFGQSTQSLLKLKVISDEEAETLLKSSIQYLVPIKSIKQNIVKILTDIYYDKAENDNKVKLSKLTYYADILPQTVKAVINNTQTLPLDSDIIKDLIAICDANIGTGKGAAVDSEFI